MKPGDVIYVFERYNYEKNLERSEPWPAINFHRVKVVTAVRQLEDGEWVYDFRKHDILESDNGDHKLVLAALKDGKVAEGGTFGCNQRIFDKESGKYFYTDVYRLDSIKNKIRVYNGSANLYKNPAYDLMH